MASWREAHTESSHFVYRQQHQEVGGAADQLFQKLGPSKLTTHNFHQLIFPLFAADVRESPLTRTYFTFTLNNLTETKEL